MAEHDTLTLALFLACVFDSDEIERGHKEIQQGKWDAEIEAFQALNRIYKASVVGKLIAELSVTVGTIDTKVPR